MSTNKTKVVVRGWADFGLAKDLPPGAFYRDEDGDVMLRVTGGFVRLTSAVGTTDGFLFKEDNNRRTGNLTVRHIFDTITLEG